ncbi:hypothetical protein FHX82_001844 [Amycolatopsis bartoniae]|uniref:Uncharacterized protein n=1 Tax=Amycolatopsis bartoniae TaxID=941986 RepID=A0A8H9IVD1_9PSEU|nr:hypothetical protein [Amycolatopsis bartoniae]MBB2934824.1 hypothetical protein [Amycolatopsis bartoniae]TVT03067.1 hypothetical protein FNH07_26130 [Amycolatopsis bartoniae]GHF44517.1 hypothetical protein GCM10017566_16800 [Amycolatopsis bartoniae]
MNEVPNWMRRLCKAIDRETRPLRQMRSDSQFAANVYAQLGCYLIEMGLGALAEIPDLDLQEAEAACQRVRGHVSDRLRDSPLAEPQPPVRVLSFGRLRLAPTIERDEPGES